MELFNPVQLNFLDTFFLMCSFEESFEEDVYTEAIKRINESDFDFSYWDSIRVLAPEGAYNLIKDFGRVLSLRLILREGYICIPVVKPSRIKNQQSRPVNLWIKPVSLWGNSNTQNEVESKIEEFYQMLLKMFKAHCEKGGVDV